MGKETSLMGTTTIRKETAFISVGMFNWKHKTPLLDAVEESGMKDPDEVSLERVNADGSLIIKVKGDIKTEDITEYDFTGDLKIQISSRASTGSYLPEFSKIMNNNNDSLIKMDYSIYNVRGEWREENALYQFSMSSLTSQDMKQRIEGILSTFTESDLPKTPTWELSLTRNEEGKRTELVWES